MAWQRGIEVNLRLGDVGCVGVAHAAPAGLQDVLAHGQERLGVGCGKRAGERLDRLGGRLLAAHDDDGLAVLKGIEPAQGAEVGGCDVRRQIVDQGLDRGLVRDQQDVAREHVEELDDLGPEGCGLGDVAVAARIAVSVGAGDRLARERLVADLIDLGIARDREALGGHVLAEDLAVEGQGAGTVEAQDGGLFAEPIGPAHRADEEPRGALQLAVDLDQAVWVEPDGVEAVPGWGSSRRICLNSLKHLDDLARLDGIEDVGDQLVRHGAVDGGLGLLLHVAGGRRSPSEARR